MPRKSAAAKAAETRLHDVSGGRPAPPSDLSPEAAEIWNDVVSGMPRGWFDAGAAQLLRRVVIQTALRRIEDKLAEFDEMGQSCSKPALDMLERHAKLSRILAVLLKELRLSPKARYTPERSAVAQRRASALAAKPWEIRATNGHGAEEDDELDWPN